MEFNIKEYLAKASQNQKLYLYPNPGNAGDALIALGTRHLFEELAINYEEVKDKKNFDPEDKIILYSGGGNLVEYYKNSREFLLDNHRKMKRLIILPHTINANEDLLADFGDNIDIITRERVSFEHVKKHVNKAHVYIAEDMAFHMHIDRVMKYKNINFSNIMWKKIFFKLTQNPEIKNVPSPRVFLKARKTEILSALQSNKNSSKVLNCFRIDPEKTNITIPPGNVDLSEVYKYGTEYDELVNYQAKKLLSFIAKYDVINTNRLHVSISGALMGKKVNLYPNSYFKNKAIYEFSLKSKFPNVEWVEA